MWSTGCHDDEFILSVFCGVHLVAHLRLLEDVLRALGVLVVTTKGTKGWTVGSIACAANRVSGGCFFGADGVGWGVRCGIHEPVE